MSFLPFLLFHLFTSILINGKEIPHNLGDQLQFIQQAWSKVHFLGEFSSGVAPMSVSQEVHIADETKRINNLSKKLSSKRLSKSLPSEVSESKLSSKSPYELYYLSKKHLIRSYLETYTSYSQSSLCLTKPKQSIEVIYFSMSRKEFKRSDKDQYFAQLFERMGYQLEKIAAFEDTQSYHAPYVIYNSEYLQISEAILNITFGDTTIRTLFIIPSSRRLVTEECTVHPPDSRFISQSSGTMEIQNLLGIQAMEKIELVELISKLTKGFPPEQLGFTRIKNSSLVGYQKVLDL